MSIADVAPYIHAGLEFVGGAAVVYQAVSKSAVAAAPHLVDAALDRAFAHPKVAAALTAHRADIEAFFDAADAQLKKRLDAAAPGTGQAPH